MPVAPFSALATGQGTVKRATVSVGTSVVTVTPPTGSWAWLEIHNLTDDTWVAAAINENPTASSADPPTQSAHWGVGTDVPGGSSKTVPLTGTLTTVRLLASAADTGVILNFYAA